MLHPDYPLWNFVGLLAVLLPLPWHWRARNVATLCLIFWLALADLVLFINTLIWADNVLDVSPVWCDISGRLLVIIPYAVPACTLAQMRRLESVASARRTVVSTSERSRRMWGEAALCIAFPLAMMPLLYIVQGHRYDIYESIGCSIPFFFSWPGVALRFFVPMACSLVSLIYAALAIRWFLVRRLQFRTILASSSSGLSVSRYLRLIALAVTDVTILIVNDVIGIAVSFIVLPVKHYPSFSKVHHDFSLISQFPEEYVPPLTHSALVFTLYNAPLYSIVFFIFFGLGEEAVAEYTLLGAAVFSFLKRLGMIKHRYSTSDPSARPPTLGSKVVSAAGHTWSQHQDSLTPDGEDKVEKLFDGDHPTHGDEVHGIPVLVERSVV